MNHLGCLTWVVIALMGCSSCGGSSSVGGTEAGNPPSERSVIGEIPTETDASSGKSKDLTALALACAADQVIATNAAAQATSADIEADCSFDLPLTVDAAYSVGFVRDERFVATLIFTNNPNASTSVYMVISNGDTPIDFGQITFDGESAIPENQPAMQNDQDGDGVDDYDDDDDDDDEIEDEAEDDCDLDGLIDDFDGDVCEGEDGEDEEEDEEGGGESED